MAGDQSPPGRPRYAGRRDARDAEMRIKAKMKWSAIAPLPRSSPHHMKAHQGGDAMERDAPLPALPHHTKAHQGEDACQWSATPRSPLFPIIRRLFTTFGP